MLISLIVREILHQDYKDISLMEPLLRLQTTSWYLILWKVVFSVSGAIPL